MARIKLLKRVANPKRRTLTAKPKRRKRVTAKPRKTATKTFKPNPAMLVTLGAMNPHRRNQTVAKRAVRRKRRLNPRKRTRRTRRNSTRVVVIAPRRRSNPRRRRRGTMRRHNPVIRRRRRYGKRRNPALFGQSFSGLQAGKMVAGGLVGVMITKTVTAMLPATILASPIFRVIASGAVAFAAGMALGRIDNTFGSAVAFGGYMQTGSLALNAFVPSIGTRLSLGELVPGRFSVPQNPISDASVMQIAAAQQGNRVTTNGLGRSYGTAY